MNNSIPYLLTVTTQMPNLIRHLKTLENLSNFEHIYVELNKYPGHLEKYFAIPTDLDPERYVIFLDSDDVRVQGNLPELRHDLYLSAENVMHRDTMWADIIRERPFFSSLMEQEVFNCGTWAMKAKHLYEYIDFLRNSPERRSNLDQLHFNLWIRQRADLSRVIDPTMFCALFSNYYTNGVKKDEEGIWRLNGKAIAVVHANGDEHLKKELWK